MCFQVDFPKEETSSEEELSETPFLIHGSEDEMKHAIRDSDLDSAFMVSAVRQVPVFFTFFHNNEKKITLSQRQVTLKESDYKAKPPTSARQPNNYQEHSSKESYGTRKPAQANPQNTTSGYGNHMNTNQRKSQSQKRDSFMAKARRAGLVVKHMCAPTLTHTQHTTHTHTHTHIHTHRRSEVE